MTAVPSKRQKLAAQKLLSEGTPTEVLTFEALSLLGQRQEHQHQHQHEADTDVTNGDRSAEQTPNPQSTQPPEEQSQYTPPPPQTELELEIEQLSSTGDGLAYSADKNHVYVVPFSIPGDRVLAKTFPQKPNPLFTHLDFIQVLRPSAQREGVTPGCKYFTVCSGCQLQMMSYEDQLRHKKTIVEKAFKYFSNLDPSRIPPVGETVGSPLQYGYRTKLTPHYDKPPKGADDKTLPAIGFGMKGTRRVLDIEQCPIGTPILNEGFPIERKKVYQTFRKRKAGATILLRESTSRKPIQSDTEKNGSEATRNDDTMAQNIGDSAANRDAGLTSKPDQTVQTEPNSESVASKNEDLNSVSRLEAYIASHNSAPSPLTLPAPKPLSVRRRRRSSGSPEIIYTYDTYKDIKTYTSTGTDWTTEHVGEFVFESRANSFFQNNNSILLSFIRYVRENCLPREEDDTTSNDNNNSNSNDTETANKNPTITSPTTSPSTPSTKTPPIKYLLDAYCGSGLFAVCLSPLFSSVLGIDIDVQGVEAARHNATANAIPNAGFIAADAEYIFADVPFPPDQTAVVIDPPRKGASVDFLRQLCVFGARRVVYVSCNVHTQARDVGMLVSGFDEVKPQGGGDEKQPGGHGKILGGATARPRPQWRYEIESLRGFDFFPQTGHVEGVCFLNRVPN
ncbi:hypothetical protein A1O1_02963 [Capronia coronata CBS 617.96]|uniref:TRAM domain-containing protein n=1 Tax=Capronia coronata CBS 617.96 TaxID=1182541 RepID=W9YNQ8_9EURO|nr:uncharacterized protein A1O1_02963 [Capronia coronata CBS 617.96]EXJ94567.1 hypothetical protein A1O1_02963 [Capronia coronata CBS 617.96]